VPVDFTPPAEPLVVEVLAHLCSSTHTQIHAKTRTTSGQFHQQNAAPFSRSLNLSRALSLASLALSLSRSLSFALTLRRRCFRGTAGTAFSSRRTLSGSSAEQCGHSTAQTAGAREVPVLSSTTAMRGEVALRLPRRSIGETPAGAKASAWR
jgi:hypothetical protein